MPTTSEDEDDTCTPTRSMEAVLQEGHGSSGGSEHVTTQRYEPDQPKLLLHNSFHGEEEKVPLDAHNGVCVCHMDYNNVHVQLSLRTNIQRTPQGA